MVTSTDWLPALAVAWATVLGPAHAQTSVPALPAPEIRLPAPAGASVGVLEPASSVFGNHHVLRSFVYTEPRPHRNARGVISVSKEALGSGVDGPDSPAAADFVAMLEAKKAGWLTSPEAGEIDGLLLVTRQGRRGDAASLLFNGQKVGGGGGDTGGMTGIEGELQWVTERGTPTLAMHLTMGILEGRGGPSGGTGNGYVAEASLGRPFAAFYGGALPAAAGARWQYLLWGSLTRDNRDVYATIDTAGNQYLKGDLRIAGTRIDMNAVTPASSSSPCEVGERAWDHLYEYRCVAKDRWKRAALETW